MVAVVQSDNTRVSKTELLEQLKKSMLEDRGIMESDLAKNASQLVWGDGNPQARIILIGEAPGASEDKAGRPFVGQAGQLLEECLQLINLSRLQDVWITNLVKHRPVANRDPSPAEKQAYAPYLDREIDIIDPKIIIPLGRHAGSYFIDDLRISHQHGQAKEICRKSADGREKSFLVVPFYHPAAGLYNSNLLPTIKQDFLNLQKVL